MLNTFGCLWKVELIFILEWFRMLWYHIWNSSLSQRTSYCFELMTWCLVILFVRKTFGTSISWKKRNSFEKYLEIFQTLANGVSENGKVTKLVATIEFISWPANFTSNNCSLNRSNSMLAAKIEIHYALLSTDKYFL